MPKLGLYEEYFERAERCRRASLLAQSKWAHDFWKQKADYFQAMADNFPVIYLRDEYKAIHK